MLRFLLIIGCVVALSWAVTRWGQPVLIGVVGALVANYIEEETKC